MAKSAARLKRESDSELVARCINELNEDLKAHEKFVREVDRRYRSYRGLLERRSQAAAWTNKQHPAYVFQSIETMVASLLDPSPRWRLRAAPLMTSPEELETIREGARANELLLSHQLSLDHFAEKQRPMDLQALIAGITASKQYWGYQEAMVRRLVPDEKTITDEESGHVLGAVPVLREQKQLMVVRDDPTSEVVDMRDLIWHQGAISLAKAARVTHRVWYSFEELKELEQAGVYANVDQLRESQDQSAGLYQREQDLFEVNRTKDQIEVLECWIERGRRVVSIGNRNVLLRDVENPFWFERLEHPYPFAVCSSMPDLFRITGISEVEVMMELQEMLWTLINQRLDNLQLINNAIFLINGDVDDPDEFEFYPGARWRVEGNVNDAIKAWTPDPMTAELSLRAESLVKGDLQNITGGMPFLSGTDTQSVDQSTATGVSIVTSLAQRRLAAKKQQFTWAKRRIGEQWSALNQQFIRTTRLVPIVGADGAEAFEEVRPELLQGFFVFETDMEEESLMRQERRAEAQSKLQVALNSAGIFASIPSQPNLNVKAFMDDYLDAFGITDKERYYSAAPQPPQLPTPAQAPQPGQEAPAALLSGVTAAQAADIQAPSHEVSQSPAVFGQREGAARGGGVNAQ